MLILAHRGACRVAPENTLTAFRIAVEQRADGVEFDAYQIEDDIVIFHDRYLERTTNGTGRLTEQRIADLRQLDAGQNEKIPLLGETLQVFTSPLLVNIEVKGLTDAVLWLSVFDRALESSRLSPANVIISSFNHCWLHALKRLRPSLQVGALTASLPLDGCAFASSLNAYSVHIDMDVIEETMVSDAHARGLKVFVYTVDHPRDWQQLHQWKVDGIFTNTPDKALAWRTKLSPPS